MNIARYLDIPHKFTTNLTPTTWNDYFFIPHFREMLMSFEETFERRRYESDTIAKQLANVKIATDYLLKHRRFYQTNTRRYFHKKCVHLAIKKIKKAKKNASEPDTLEFWKYWKRGFLNITEEQDLIINNYKNGSLDLQSGDWSLEAESISFYYASKYCEHKITCIEGSAPSLGGRRPTPQWSWPLIPQDSAIAISKIDFLPLSLENRLLFADFLHRGSCERPFFWDGAINMLSYLILTVVNYYDESSFEFSECFAHLAPHVEYKKWSPSNAKHLPQLNGFCNMMVNVRRNTKHALKIDSALRCAGLLGLKKVARKSGMES